MTPDDILVAIEFSKMRNVSIEELKKTLDSERLDTPDKYGYYPIHMIVKEGLDIIDFAVERGADINVIDKGGNTPLRYSLEIGHHEISKKLLELGARVDLEDRYGNNSLWIAVWKWGKNSNEIIDMILQRGGDPDNKNKNDVSARDLAKGMKLRYHPAISPPEFKPHP